MSLREIKVGTFTVSERARELVNEVLDSGRISYGPLSQEFEQRMAMLHGNKYGVLSNSGTSSLQVALQAMKELHGWEDGDEVIVPATTFVATVNIVLHNRMTSVLVDIEPDTYNINPAMVEAAITDRTRAVIAVHLFGQQANMKELRKVLDGKPIKLIADSAECMFATHHTQPVGYWADISCFSTYTAHLVTTGVGGLSITNHPDYAAKMRSLVNHGRDGVYISIDDSDSKDREVTERRFKFDSIGHSFRITELEAALGLAQTEHGVWQAMIAKRQHNASVLTSALYPVRDRLAIPKVGAGNSHVWMMYPIVLKDGGEQAPLDDIRQKANKWPLVHFLEERGIETREMLPLLSQPIYQRLWGKSVLVPNSTPVSEWVLRGGFYVASHQGLDASDMQYIADAIISYWAK
jgi:perosamine synthetase